MTPNHEQAVSFLRALAQSRYRLYTTQLIIAETHTLLRSRLRHRGRDYALSVAHNAVAGILRSTVAIESITATDARQAVETLLAHPDRALSYTDAISFAVMRRLGISYVFAFDDDFAVAGFSNIVHVL